MIAVASTIILACAGGPSDDDPACQGGKCDDVGPNGVANCWAGGDPMWNRSGGDQIAYTQLDDSGKRRLMLAFDGDELCNLSGGRDDYAAAFSPDGRRYAFLSNRAGDVDGDGELDTDLYVVDMDELGPSGRPTARAAALGCGGPGEARLADVPPIFAAESRVVFASRAPDQPWMVSSVGAVEGGCEAGFVVLEVPVAPTAADLFAHESPLFGAPDGQGQDDYDDALREGLEILMSEEGTLDGDDRNDIAALSYANLIELHEDPKSPVARVRAHLDARLEAGDFSEFSEVEYFDRLGDMLRLYESDQHIRGIAFDPDPGRMSIAVSTHATGVTIYDHVNRDGTGSTQDPLVSLRIGPADLDVGFFAPGLSWQGPRLAFSVAEFPLPRILVWDGGRSLTDAQIDSLLADASKSWGPHGISRHGGGLIIDKDLVGRQPALGPNGGSGARLDGERIAFAETSIVPEPTCIDSAGQPVASLCPFELEEPGVECRDHLGEPLSAEQAGRWCPNTDAIPPTTTRVLAGNHWEVTGPEGVVPIADHDREQANPAFRP